MNPDDSQRAIIYFAISNLIKDCYEFLDSASKLPPEQINQDELQFIDDLLVAASIIEDEMAKELDLINTHIDRPDWSKLG